jgi:hypothetical protein
MKTKESDNRGTPKWLMQLFENWFDPCPLNNKPEIDGLNIEWKDKTYVNPPFSQTTKWTIKSVEEWKKGKTIIILTRADLTTNYSRLLIENKAKFLYCSELINFVGIEGEKLHSPFPSILWILDKEEMKE